MGMVVRDDQFDGEFLKDRLVPVIHPLAFWWFVLSLSSTIIPENSLCIFLGLRLYTVEFYDS